MHKKLRTLYLKDFFFLLSAEKLKLQEELFRLRSHRKDGEAKKEHLLNRAKILQSRAASHKAKVTTILSLFLVLLNKLPVFF